ncbi:MAG: thylakoid membrane photosystem I accumulation factor [Cyanobacteriota bacterium]|nr:thylakoid membrane photosystem I accumulation factor [Cyanobacteriota bacterium]
MLAWLIRPLLCLLLTLVLGGTGFGQPAAASLTNNRYDGNIYALYAGNGSLVPPRSTLAEAMAQQRPAVLVYYLDDAAASKRFAAEVSELQRLWGNSIELIPLATDPLQNRSDTGPSDPAHYWKGVVPQVVVFDGRGQVLLDASGQVEPAVLNKAISAATGIALPEKELNSRTISFNELNSEVVNQP